MRCAPAFSNGTPPTISTALTISRPQNRERKARICWHTIFICGKPHWYGKLLKQRGLLSRQADIRRGIDASRIAFLPAVLMIVTTRLCRFPRRRLEALLVEIPHLE